MMMPTVVKGHKRKGDMVRTHSRKSASSKMMESGKEGLMARLAKNPGLKKYMSNPAIVSKMKSMVSKLSK